MRTPRTIGFKISMGFGLLIIAIILGTELSRSVVRGLNRTQDQLSGNLEPSTRRLIELQNKLRYSGDLLGAINNIEQEKRPLLLGELKIIVEDRIPGSVMEIDRLAGNWTIYDRNSYQTIRQMISDSIRTGTENFIAQSILKGPGLTDTDLNKLRRNFKKSEEKLDELISRFEAHIVQAGEDSDLSYRQAMNSLLIMGCILILAGILTAILLNYSLRGPIRQYTDTISSIGRGIIPERKFPEGRDEMGQIGAALNRVIKGFRNMAHFSEEIGKGNFRAKFEPQSNEDILGNSLIRLRDDLQNAAIEEEKRKREDEHRNWASQGIARFSEILREYSSDKQLLSENLISELVRYLGARVGGLFLIGPAEEGRQVIRLAASYAYNRKKHLQKTLELKEGLIGRCIQEGSTLFLTDIPDDYIRIKSGLGGDNPRSLLIVPIRLTETIIGVIEIASLEIIEEFQIEFVERIGSTIASSLAGKHGRAPA